MEREKERKGEREEESERNIDNKLIMEDEEQVDR